MNPIGFFKEAWVELRKSTWLSRQQAVGSTVVVVVLVLILSIFISGVDFALSLVLGALLGTR
ncbi:MAG: preprotein translocase subunit SecE [Elusimicrobia bacterium]|nr:preprotein translocase subunit SecE [Elusimicrobiota bacterium]